MQKVQFHAEIDIKSFLSQLENSELEEFLRETSAILAQRKAGDKNAVETALLQRLNEECALPMEQIKSFKALNRKKENGKLTPSENEELLLLIRQEERLRLKRIQILGELAQLRGTSLHEMAKELGIISSNDE
jgi:hypothetical protein